MSRLPDLVRGVSTLGDALYRVKTTGELFVPTSFRAFALLVAFFTMPSFAADVLCYIRGLELGTITPVQAGRYTASFVAEHGGVGVTHGDAAEKGIGRIWTFTPELDPDYSQGADDSWDDIFEDEDVDIATDGEVIAQ